MDFKKLEELLKREKSRVYDTEKKDKDIDRTEKKKRREKVEKIKDLPIFDFKEEILEKVENNQCVIITADTGAGKSTQVPQFLYEAGYNVVVTQPRRLAAMNLAKRVADEMGTELGDLVGVKTAEYKIASNKTNILYCTDGLQLVRELSGAEEGKKKILVLDEVHEWNLNMEVLVAWAKRQMQLDPNFKVVLMSATLEAEQLARFFYGGEAPEYLNEKIIEVPGRLYPIKDEVIEITAVDNLNDYKLLSRIAELIAKKRNILIFQPGKTEIKDTITIVSQYLKDLGLSVPILPLHGELSYEQQKRAFEHYPDGKIVVSTNVAQTSVTIDDIDVVIDTARERRIELIDGVESLVLKPISKADCLQRRGRAGRTKEGIYILASATSLDKRLDYPKAEIQRRLLDQVVLRLAVAGLDAEELEFFHQPDKEQIHKAKQTLLYLGAFTEDGEVTDIGYEMSLLPVDVRLARMLVEGKKYDLVTEMILLSAVASAGNLILYHKENRLNDPYSLITVQDSDLIAKLELFLKLYKITKEDDDSIDEKEKHERTKKILDSYGINSKTFRNVKIKFSNIKNALRGRNLELKKIVDISLDILNKPELRKALLAGYLDHLYIFRGHDRFGAYYQSKHENQIRHVNNRSFVYKTVTGEIIAAHPFNLQTRLGRNIIYLLDDILVFSPEYLAEFDLPDLQKSYEFDIKEDDDIILKINIAYDNPFAYSPIKAVADKQLNKESFIDNPDLLEQYLNYVSDAIFEERLFPDLLAEIYEENKKELENLKKYVSYLYFIKGDENLLDYKKYLLDIYKKYFRKHLFTSKREFKLMIENGQIDPRIFLISNYIDRNFEKESFISYDGISIAIELEYQYNKLVAKLNLDNFFEEEILNIDYDILLDELKDKHYHQLAFVYHNEAFPNWTRLKDFVLKEYKERLFNEFMQHHEIVELEIPDDPKKLLKLEPVLLSDEVEIYAYPYYSVNQEKGKLEIKWTLDKRDANFKNSSLDYAIYNYRQHLEELKIGLKSNELKNDIFDFIEYLENGSNFKKPIIQYYSNLLKELASRLENNIYKTVYDDIVKEFKDLRKEIKYYLQNLNKLLEENKVLLDKKVELQNENELLFLLDENANEREADSIEVLDDFHRIYKWNFIKENEIFFKIDTAKQNVEKMKNFSKLSKEQFFTLRELEYTYNIDIIAKLLEVADFRKKLVESFRENRVIKKFIRENLDQLSDDDLYKQLLSKDGLYIEYFDYNIGRGNFGQDYVYNREADIVRIVKLPELKGKLEFLIFDKFGQENLAIRFIPDLTLSEGSNQDGINVIDFDALGAFGQILQQAMNKKKK